MDLTIFLLNRIYEDESDARRAQDSWGSNSTSNIRTLARTRHMLLFGEEARARHVALWDPARVLVESDVKRRLILRAGHATHLDRVTDSGHAGGVATEPDLGEQILRALALPYAGHPDYQRELAPGYV